MTASANLVDSTSSNNNSRPLKSGTGADHTPSSAMAAVALLEESQPEVCAHAINHLLEVVDFFWYEIADSVTRILQLAQQLAQPAPTWLLLSKVHFHLGDYDKSVEYALKAGPLFSIGDKSPFVETVMTKAIDQYVEARVRLEADPQVVVDAALEALVERMVAECIERQEMRQAIGIAIEAHRLDILEACLKGCPMEKLPGLLFYAQQAAMDHISSLEHQRRVLSIVANVAVNVPEPDLVFYADCLVAMSDASACAQLIRRMASQLLADPAEELRLTTLQICFNVAADATRDFINVVLEEVKQIGPAEGPLGDLVAVLNEQTSLRLQLEFLYRNNKADMNIMEKIKGCLSPQNSMHHSVLSCANALMHCGSTNDEFLRKNLDWLGHATNWAKFTAASSLGVIHKGQVGKGREILKPYLPANDGSGSPYAEGGAMFALGLINTRLVSVDKEYFVEQLSKTENEVLHHGICLGLGASAISSDDWELVDLIKGILYNDNAVSGEAAAIAIGLIHHSSGDVEVAEEILSYAHETQHEKSIRGIALAISLIFTGQREKADSFIEALIHDKDPILRYGGMWVLASAYAGSSDNRALGRLLHTAVSDPDDNVRRAAVTALGFINCRNPAELPRMIDLLTESYNPHVRYGAALALGIAFAGTGDKKAIELVKPMCKDFTDFVRQGAYISLAMILMQHNDTTCDDVSWVRSTLDSVITAKLEDAMARFGAVLAQGIIDAGGRNAVVSLTSAAGHLNSTAVAGCILFCQFWYWYPLTHFLSFALSPTALIAVDATLQIPKFDVICNAKPSSFAPPPPVKPSAVAAPKKLITAVLSTTAKAAARAKKSGKSSSTSMEVDVAVPTPIPTPTPAPAPAAAPQVGSMMEVDVDNAPSPQPTPDPAQDSTSSSEPVVEPDSFVLGNLSRVTPFQLPLITFPTDGRYQPLHNRWRGEILVVRDRDRTRPADYIKPGETEKPEGGDEPAPPPSFEVPDV